MRLLELSNLLDLVHKVSSINILHHKIQSVLKYKDKGIKEEREENEGSGMNKSSAIYKTVVFCHVFVKVRYCALPWSGNRSAAE